MARMKAGKIRLPDDLIGDDGLVGVLAKPDLENEAGWCEDRLAICGAAGCRCEPDYLRNPTTWRMQYKRMLTYSLCHFQNIIVSDIMKSSGPIALPRNLSALYPDWGSRFVPRRSGLTWRFDWYALGKIGSIPKAWQALPGGRHCVFEQLSPNQFR